MQSKTCCGCGVVKNLDEFYRRPGSNDGYRSKCIPCHIEISNLSKARKSKQAKKQDWINQNYGISNAEYNKLLLLQFGRCAICSTSQLDLETPLVVDHNHNTGNIRSLLCRDCNLGLGNFKDTVELLINAIKYLNQHNKTQVN